MTKSFEIQLSGTDYREQSDPACGVTKYCGDQSMTWSSRTDSGSTAINPTGSQQTGKMSVGAAAVMELQAALISAGFSVGKSGADGLWGSDTQKAAEAAAVKFGLDPSSATFRSELLVKLSIVGTTVDKVKEQANKIIEMVNPEGPIYKKPIVYIGGVAVIGLISVLLKSKNKKVNLSGLRSKKSRKAGKRNCSCRR